MGAQRRSSAQYEQAVALDPAFALAWARLSLALSQRYAFVTRSPQDAEMARTAAERALELAPSMPEGHVALGDYQFWVRKDPDRAYEAYAHGLSLAPDDALLLRGMARVERARGRWEEGVTHLRRAQALDPRSWRGELQLGRFLLSLRRTGEARDALDRGLALAPASLDLIALKAETYLREGDLAGARVVMAASKEVEPTALVAYFATAGDFYWALDDVQRDLLLRLTPAAFDGDRATWGLVLAQAWALQGEKAKTREYAEEARKGFAAQVAETGNRQPNIYLALALAYLGRKAEAVREGEGSLGLTSIATHYTERPYIQYQVVRIHILVGNHGRALDLLEPLLKGPHLTPGLLRIDPNFDPLRSNPRFEKLAQGS
jgi:tetratricopeptide (TPR) repeat protein